MRGRAAVVSGASLACLPELPLGAWLGGGGQPGPEVSVDARGDHLIVASYWTSGGKYPLFFLGEWARAGEPAQR